MPSFPSHHRLKGITEDQRQMERCNTGPSQTFYRTHHMKFMDVTEPKREFDKYPQVRLLILTERLLVMVDPSRQGHSVKTQH